METTLKVAVLGTGTMGAAMARNLLKAGHEVSVWNRDPAKTEPLAADGARRAGTPAEAAEGADAVLTMVYDAEAVSEVMVHPRSRRAARSSATTASFARGIS